LRTRTAYHEAGHGALSAAIVDTPRHMSIRRDEYVLGRTLVFHAHDPRVLVQVNLAGFAAEHLLTGRRPARFSEEVRFGILAQQVSPADFPEVLAGRDGCAAVAALVSMGITDNEAILSEAERFYTIARESLRAVWPAVEALAGALLRHEEIDRDGVDGALSDLEIYHPVCAVQEAHGLRT
jgi:hypothetical protein